MATEKFIKKEKRLKNKPLIGKNLSPLLTVISKSMITKLAMNGITRGILVNQYKIGQANSIHVLLGQDGGDGKPRVTNS